MWMADSNRPYANDDMLMMSVKIQHWKLLVLDYLNIPLITKCHLVTYGKTLDKRDSPYNGYA